MHCISKFWIVNIHQVTCSFEVIPELSVSPLKKSRFFQTFSCRNSISMTMKRKLKQIKDENCSQKECTKTCKKCKVGPVVVDFTSADNDSVDAAMLTGTELLFMARQEINKSVLAPNEVDDETHHQVVSQLFEMAISAFESKQDKTIDYAKCLYEFALFLNTKYLFEKSLAVLEQLPDSVGEKWILLGKVFLQLAHFETLDAHARMQLESKAYDSFGKVSDEANSNTVDTRISIANSILNHALLLKSKLIGIFVLR
jgi:hypothetical protein